MSSGGYPTRYASLSDSELKLVFSTENWARPEMSPQEKLEACQEVENRLAQADGTTPRAVISENMSGAACGYQAGPVIALNSNVLDAGVFKVEYLDEQGNTQVQLMPVAAPNWTTYDTVCHEHQHCVQIDQGRSQGQAYIDPSADYDLYRLQPDEREAFDMGISRTQSTLQHIEGVLEREDQNKEEYLASIQADSYESALERAQMHYQDEYIQQTVDSVIYDYRDGVSRSYNTQSEIGVLQALEWSPTQEVSMSSIQYDSESAAQQESGLSAWESELFDDESGGGVAVEESQGQDQDQDMNQDYGM